MRVYEALPGTPLWIGICIAVVLMTVFLVSRSFFGVADDASSGDFRLAVFHILLTAYTPSAYVHLLQAARESAKELGWVISHTPVTQAILDGTGKHLWWGLVIAGSLGIAGGIYATNVTTFGSDPWDWQQNGFDARWMRVLGPFFAWWMGCILYVLAVDSARLSRLSDNIHSLDLFDLRPYQPLIKQGLTNALLLVGLVSVLALFLLEPGFVLVMIQFVSLIAIFAWIGLMLPLRGIRKKIKAAKEAELDWCRQNLKIARDDLKSATEGSRSISEILSYRSILEDIKNWPFDSPSLTRFALYLLIPVGSMFGGAFVERGLDFFFP